MIGFYTTAGLNRFTGYGKVERGLVAGFHAEGVRVVPSGPVNDMDYTTLPEAHRHWLDYGGQVEDVIVTASPKKCGPSWHTQGKRVWLFTMSESTKVSQQWVNAINEWCAGVFVPCPELVDIYYASGVDVPVFDVGLGMDYYDPIPTPKYRHQVFTFMTYSYGDMRKGAHLAMLAFKRVFGDDPGYKLLVKARSARMSWLAGCMDPQIEVFDAFLTEGEWFALLSRIEAFVFPSYAEGYGYPPREATLVNTPAIATQKLGLWDVEQWGIPLRVGRARRSMFEVEEANAADSDWWEPDLEHLAEQMRWVADHYTEAVAKAEAGRQYLLANYTWQKTAQRIMEAINAHHGAAN